MKKLTVLCSLPGRGGPRPDRLRRGTIALGYLEGEASCQGLILRRSRRLRTP